MTTGVPVVKTNGTGNEFVLVDERVAPVGDRAAFARRVCDPAHGLGADGVLFVQHSERFDARMQIVNADGSEAEMCGNGMRCVARYLDEHDGRGEATVETVAGPIGTRILSRAPYRVAVEMAEPRIGEPHEVARFSRRAGRRRQPARRDSRRPTSTRWTSPSSARGSSATRGIPTAPTSTSSRRTSAAGACGTGSAAPVRRKPAEPARSRSPPS